MILLALVQILSPSLELIHFALFFVIKAFTLCLEGDLSPLLPDIPLMLWSYDFLKTFFSPIALWYIKNSVLVSDVIFPSLVEGPVISLHHLL